MARREAIALAAAAFSVLGAAARIVQSRESSSAHEAGMVGGSTSVPTVSDDSLGEAAANTAANDPFRLANHPSTVRYDVRVESGLGAIGGAIAAPMRPTLALRAIVGGPPWQAIVDGIPDQPPGTIVRSGATFGKLAVRSVGRDTVVIQAPDTVWKLTLSQAHP
jgi:hypothetical protein